MISAYTAGLFDGEGTVTLARKNKGDPFRRPSVSISNTAMELLGFLKERYGGSICSKRNYKEHHLPSFTWGLRETKCLAFLSDIIPHVREPNKRYRILLLLKEYKTLTKRNGKYTEEQRIARLDFENRFFHPGNPPTSYRPSRAERCL